MATYGFASSSPARPHGLVPGGAPGMVDPWEGGTPRAGRTSAPLSAAAGRGRRGGAPPPERRRRASTLPSPARWRWRRGATRCIQADSKRCKKIYHALRLNQQVDSFGWTIWFCSWSTFCSDISRATTQFGLAFFYFHVKSRLSIQPPSFETQKKHMELGKDVLFKQIFDLTVSDKEILPHSGSVRSIFYPERSNHLPQISCKPTQGNLASTFLNSRQVIKVTIPDRSGQDKRQVNAGKAPGFKQGTVLHQTYQGTKNFLPLPSPSLKSS